MAEGFQSFSATHLARRLVWNRKLGQVFLCGSAVIGERWSRGQAWAREPGGIRGKRDGHAQAYCNRGRRMRRSFPAGAGRRSKTGKLARTKSAGRARAVCATAERHDGGDAAETFQ